MHVTFIHGIGNKPARDDLTTHWKQALADEGQGPGVDLDYEQVSVEMVYWADVLYSDPTPSGVTESYEAVDEGTVADVELAGLLAQPDAEGEFVRKLAAQMVENTVAEMTAPVVQERLEILPPFLAKRVMKTFVRDVHHYLFNSEFTPRPKKTYRVRDEIRERTITLLEQGAAKEPPHILVTHSMGTVIGYDCLKRVPECPGVDGFMTIGSPLGLDEIQDCLKPEWSPTDGFPSKVKDRWSNVFDRFDIVSIGDPNLADDFKQNDVEMVTDLSVKNDGTWRHDISKYFARQQLRRELAGLLGLSYP